MNPLTRVVFAKRLLVCEPDLLKLIKLSYVTPTFMDAFVNFGMLAEFALRYPKNYSDTYNKLLKRGCFDDLTKKMSDVWYDTYKNVDVDNIPKFLYGLAYNYYRNYYYIHYDFNLFLFPGMLPDDCLDLHLGNFQNGNRSLIPGALPKNLSTLFVDNFANGGKPLTLEILPPQMQCGCLMFFENCREIYPVKKIIHTDFFSNFKHRIS